MFLESVLNGNGVTKVSAIYNIYSENKLGILWEDTDIWFKRELGGFPCVAWQPLNPPLPYLYKR